MNKILIIRFSSIGDIVLTSPVIRSLKSAKPEIEIHYLSKPQFQNILIHNPYLSKVHLWEGNKTLSTLRKEKFDYILDLHRNLRSQKVKLALLRPSISFDKQNRKKYLMVRNHDLSEPVSHIVTRYGATLEALGISLDNLGLDFFLPESASTKADQEINDLLPNLEPALAVVLGANHPTKRWIPEHFVKLINLYQKPVILIGGKDSLQEAEIIKKQIKPPYLDAVGKYDILTAAALMKKCQAVLTHDTGFMHIAAAFGMKIFSLWGNTVPEFGMTPYKSPHLVFETHGLDCRPCSKIGFDQCPKGHFRCMNDLKPEVVLKGMTQPGFIVSP